MPGGGAEEQERAEVEAAGRERGEEWPAQLQAVVVEQYAASESGRAIGESRAGETKPKDAAA
jgi:hypothetical protein